MVSGLVRVFTLAFSSSLAGFDDRELRDFIGDKEVVSIRDHFFVKDELPYLAVVVTYNLLRPEEGRPAATERRQRDSREEWRETLEEGDWPLFNTLRDWRNGQAKEEGIPPYVICTNRQLAEIAHKRPQGLAALRLNTSRMVASFFPLRNTPKQGETAIHYGNEERFPAQIRPATRHRSSFVAGRGKYPVYASRAVCGKSSSSRRLSDRS